MATYSLAYGTETLLTTAGLNSLTQANSMVSSARVNTTDLNLNELVRVTIVTNATGTSSTGKVQVWVAGSTDGTNFADDRNQHLLGVMDCTLDATTYSATYNIADAFGGVVPPAYKIRIYNVTGAALHTSGNTVHYRGVKLTSA